MVLVIQVNVGTSGAEIGAAFGGNKVRRSPSLSKWRDGILTASDSRRVLGGEQQLSVNLHHNS